MLPGIMEAYAMPATKHFKQTGPPYDAPKNSLQESAA